MLENKTILDKDNNIVEECVSFTNNIPQFFEIKKDYKIVYAIDKYYIKPHWNGTEWEESATEEEIKAWQEKNKKEENLQITEEQQLLSAVLLENVEIKEQLKQQQELSATLALQIAELKGGNANV